MWHLFGFWVVGEFWPLSWVPWADLWSVHGVAGVAIRNTSGFPGSHGYLPKLRRESAVHLESRQGTLRTFCEIVPRTRGSIVLAVAHLILQMDVYAGGRVPSVPEGSGVSLGKKLRLRTGQ